MRISTAVLNGLKRKAKKRGMTYHEYVRDLLLHYASTTTPARPPKVKYISLQVGHPRRRG